MPGGADLGPDLAPFPTGSTPRGRPGYRLSGGEKQRIALARLLLKAPPVVVLDEATAHLDSESEAAIQRALETALTGRTSLVIAHRLSTIREAHQILVVDAGRSSARHPRGAAQGRRTLRRAVPDPVRAPGGPARPAGGLSVQLPHRRGRNPSGAVHDHGQDRYMCIDLATIMELSGEAAQQRRSPAARQRPRLPPVTALPIPARPGVRTFTIAVFGEPRPAVGPSASLTCSHRPA